MPRIKLTRRRHIRHVDWRHAGWTIDWNALRPLGRDYRRGGLVRIRPVHLGRSSHIMIQAGGGGERKSPTLTRRLGRAEQNGSPDRDRPSGAGWVARMSPTGPYLQRDVLIALRYIKQSLGGFAPTKKGKRRLAAGR